MQALRERFSQQKLLTLLVTVITFLIIGLMCYVLFGLWAITAEWDEPALSEQGTIIVNSQPLQTTFEESAVHQYEFSGESGQHLWIVVDVLSGRPITLEIYDNYNGSDVIIRENGEGISANWALVNDEDYVIRIHGERRTEYSIRILSR